ncbi:hypothetical protein BTHE68_40640 [Burkholderia sp. THE68]|uniref:CGNR zinc finger domain-containing protein n=1 Tax=Burkholderia sp. THE68 TaxID=758782 RepID=UPI001316CD32|nr:CGNR zinc finger domain-containing protein [Burkholderia sp. THE68]BBU30330.1 hypothetical protein BTHE68_40640 [Burkholderia sp. THE68]
MSDPDFLLLADDPALDFLNTVARSEDGLYDFLKTDQDVIEWMRAEGFAPSSEISVFKRGALLGAAQNLRDIIRKLVHQKKNGKRIDIAPLNSFLSHGKYTIQLSKSKGGMLTMTPSYERGTPEQFLIEIGVSAAELIARGDFDLIRKCESDDCVLWFYDKTKAHRRRWCSMALCGNRHKVANFRARQRQNAA